MLSNETVLDLESICLWLGGIVGQGSLDIFIDWPDDQENWLLSSRSH